MLCHEHRVTYRRTDQAAALREDQTDEEEKNRRTVPMSSVRLGPALAHARTPDFFESVTDDAWSRVK